jgi:hypothetical protein
MTGNEPLPTLLQGTVAHWLSVTDGPRAVRLYRTALGPVVHYRLKDRSGRVVVAQLRVGRAEFLLPENRHDRPGSRRAQIT